LDEMEFGRYRLLSLIGQGGMGKVYKARDTDLGRDVAIKVLSTELSIDDEYRERFRREARTAARLDEPHIIPVYEAGEIDERLYLVMRMVDGVDVQGLLQRDGPMKPQRAVHVIEQLSDALDAAHTAGLVHRDVKPSNALVTGNDFVYLIDFGIAHDTAAAKLTQTGAIFGSWAYMAPERFDASIVDASGDIYALACVLYECLTGATPYPGGPQQQCNAHASHDPPKPSRANAAIPIGFDRVIARGMAKEPDDRYPSARELAADARRALTTPPGSTPGLVAPTRHHQQVPPTLPPTGTMAARQVGGLHVTVAPQPRPPTPGPQSVRARRRRQGFKGPLVVAVVVVVVAGAGFISYLLQPNSLTAQNPTGQAPMDSGPNVGRTGHAEIPSGQAVLPFAGLNGPDAVAVDSVGNVYVADSGNNRAVEVAAGTSGSTELPFVGLGNPSGIAVDSARAVYVTNVTSSRVLKLPAGSSSTVELSITGVNGPQGIATDAAGDLYITAGNRVLKVPAGSSNTVELAFTGLHNPTGVAVDSAGGIYVADSGNNRVLKLTGGSVQDMSFTGLNNPDGVAVDSSGNVYVADTGNNRVLKLAANSSTSITVLSNSFNNPRGLAADAVGDVYVADTGNSRVVKLPAG
jgi:serine/threonine protein kinase, bacterial